MKTHTSNFKNEIKLLGKEIDSKITFGSTVLGKDDLNSVTPSFQGSILKSVMKELDIDSNVDIPLNTVLKYEFGVKVNGEYEYINFGNYVVYKSEKQEDTNSYRITCYDKMLYSMKEYEKMNITYPITLRNYINAVCSHLGLTFKDNSGTFANYNRTIQNELYIDKDGNSLGYTFRDVFDELAQATASTICINNNDELEIRYINDTEDTIDEEFLRDVNVNFGEKFGAVNTIVLSRSAESDNIYYPETLPANPYELKIVDNQIMNGNDRADYLPDIYNKLNGLEFYINDFSSTGICYYDLCDRYNVKVGDKTYSCVMFNDEILVTQGLRENVFTDMPKETKTDYTKADKTDRRINQTNLNVDKQNQEIQALVETVKDIEVDTTLTKQASGNPITIEDAGAYPCENFIVEGKSEQDGTPTPDTPVEIDTVKGIENLFSYGNSNISGTKNGVTYNYDKDTQIWTLDGTATGQVDISFTPPKTLVLPSDIYRQTQFYLGGTISNGGVTTYSQDRNNGWKGIHAGINSNQTESSLLNYPMEITLNASYIVRVASGTVLSNFQFRTQLTKTSEEYPFIPYGSRYLINKITGENIFNENKEKDNFYYTSTGTTQTDNINKFINQKIKANSRNYVVSYKNRYSKLNGTDVSSYVRIVEFNSSNTFIKRTLYSNNNSIITLDENTTYFILSIDSGPNAYFEELMINAGTVALPYKPYKEKIITYDLKKENLFDISSWITKGNNSNYYSYSNGVLTINKLDDRGLSKFTEDEKIFLPNGTYYLDNKELPNGVRIYNDGTDYPITSVGSFKVTLGYIYLKFVSSTVVTCQPKIYKVSSIGDYHELVSINDIKDKLDEASGVLTKRIGKVVLDGSEDWKLSSTESMPYIYLSGALAPTSNNVIPNMLCTHYKVMKRNGLTNGYTTLSPTKNLLFYDEVNGSSLDTWKTYLQEQYNAGTPVTVCYVLAEPETIQLKPTEIELFKGINNIYTLDDLEPNMNITYLTDIKMNAQYATKSELKVAENSIKASVSGEITELDKKTEASLELKVDRNDNDQIVSMINASADDITLAGGSKINITTAGKLLISAGNFKLDENGNVTANSGVFNDCTASNLNITSGQISLTGNQNNPKFTIANIEDNTKYLQLMPSSLEVFYKNLLTLVVSGALSDPFIIFTNYDNNNLVSQLTSRYLRITNGNQTTMITPTRIDVGNIDSGICSLNSTDVLFIPFNKTFETVPNVVVTPYTTTTGVIAPKVRSISNTGFEATIGGSGFSNVQCCWIAIS